MCVSSIVFCHAVKPLVFTDPRDATKHLECTHIVDLLPLLHLVLWSIRLASILGYKISAFSKIKHHLINIFYSVESFRHSRNWRSEWVQIIANLFCTQLQEVVCLFFKYYFILCHLHFFNFVKKINKESVREREKQKLFFHFNVFWRRIQFERGKFLSFQKAIKF